MEGGADVWLFNGLVLAVIAISDIVIQSMALHVALARAHRAPGDLAGLSFVLTCLAVVGGWIAAGVLVGRLWTPPTCMAADVTALWLGALYPATIWPAWRQARRAQARLPGWYWPAQAAGALLLAALGGFPCAFTG